MNNRRQFIAIAGAGLGLAPILAWLGRSEAVEAGVVETGAIVENPFLVQKTDEAWRAALTPEQYRVLRGQRTERAFSSPLDREKRTGMFACAACGQQLFSSATKYDSRTGWPSFWEPLGGAVGTSTDRSLFMVRIEVHCARCGSHLGHLFPDGPQPTGERYCMNGVAMTFNPEA